MKIVVTDGYTLNPDDLSWEKIAGYGALTVFDRTPADLIVERCKNATIILTNKVPFNSDTINGLFEVKLISVLATGYNIIDIEAAKQKGITVCNVPAYSTASVAQHTFALLLELINGVGLHAKAVLDGEWQRSPDFSFAKKRITELEGKTIGIIGFGNIGERTAQIAKAFGMNVVYNSRSKKATTLAQFRDLEPLFAESDIVSLHCPLTSFNHQFVNKRLLQLMKPSALLINTARGQLIHEQDLANALNEGILAGAALDVLSTEPPTEGNPLLTASNCIITPHIAWMSKEARQRIMNITANNIEAFLSRNPMNVVNV